MTEHNHSVVWIDHREALILIGAAGHSLEEAAKIRPCAARTVKSRVNGARRRLAQRESETAEGAPAAI